MNHRQKSKQYGKWVFVKYPGDLAVYAVCQHCGFTYPCYRKEDGLIFVPDFKKVYKYCPECGLKMKLFNVNVVYKQN